jgi:hypothetical protein
MKRQGGIPAVEHAFIIIILRQGYFYEVDMLPFFLRSLNILLVTIFDYLASHNVLFPVVTGY